MAYGARVSGIRILDGPMTDAMEATAFTKNMDINDIYSCRSNLRRIHVHCTSAVCSAHVQACKTSIMSIKTTYNTVLKGTLIECINVILISAGAPKTTVKPLTDRIFWPRRDYVTGLSLVVMAMARCSWSPVATVVTMAITATLTATLTPSTHLP